MKMRRSGLIDGDVLIHTASAVGELKLEFDSDGEDVYTVRPDRAKEHIRAAVDSLRAELKLDVVSIALSDRVNFRKALFPEYKSKRPARKPYLLPEMLAYVESEYPTISLPMLEADDVMGIYSTSADARTVICSIDKDMKTVPGWLYDGKGKAKKILQWEADYWHMFQTLTGDSTDGYPGCPGIGPKKAEAILAELAPEEYWPHVLATYEAKGLTEDDALMQARLARILRTEDYDMDTGEIRLWHPENITASTVMTKATLTVAPSVASN